MSSGGPEWASPAERGEGERGTGVVDVNKTSAEDAVTPSMLAGRRAPAIASHLPAVHRYN